MRILEVGGAYVKSPESIGAGVVPAGIIAAGIESAGSIGAGVEPTGSIATGIAHNCGCGKQSVEAAGKSSFPQINSKRLVRVCISSSSSSHFSSPC